MNWNLMRHFHPIRTLATLTRKRDSFWLLGPLIVGIGILGGAAARAQVPDADCFSGSCGGQKGIPRCPDGFDEVGFVLYANSKANAANDCETVIPCTNLGSGDGFEHEYRRFCPSLMRGSWVRFAS